MLDIIYATMLLAGIVGAAGWIVYQLVAYKLG